MLIYEEEFGADADGNRGIMQIVAELEQDDAEEIRAQIEAQYEQGTDKYTIYMFDLFDGEHQFEVYASDYFNYAELKEM